MTALNKQELRSKSRAASAGEWIKESGDGWEAICSSDDQANGNFIIAHFEGPDAKANREFVQVANPTTVLELLDELEAAEKRIAELEAQKFKVEMPESFYPDGDIDSPLAVDELEVIAAIVEAGGKPVAFCKRCDREIDLTHRPDGSHYCHAPAAGIGVKGE
ncbi:ead/Ea22-like family protein [Salmonella enterica subsp. enterica serovar Weltevreden]|nr:ead/Ea22-like family protein [Salmonella enterica subsp. enterica]EDU5496427.1 ead/Ea22-like family protein [Salmonella enterica]EHA3471900.1 ead/Ea22-like family protein [Salmonella enterica subsp. enterica serovar Weltevreden]EHQ9651080.1 ead/Ea22-like family protein [Salmonella enterica]EHU0391649.1 ead/Ea22-like family protein [Salmonella enterica]